MTTALESIDKYLHATDIMRAEIKNCQRSSLIIETLCHGNSYDFAITSQLKF